ncbi:unnamed protein product [Adineta ricciae]|uniref:Uncharacterized protein n=1 Tax=Adineta ricciae TaxID=249248 RepID=A0A816B6C8_ADIRI|nr:unnamed protein product [Adineta ricciae]
MSVISTRGDDSQTSEDVELTQLVYSIRIENHQDDNPVPFGIPVYCDAEQTTFEEVAGICANKDDQNAKSLTIRSFTTGLIFLDGMSFYQMWYYITNLYAPCKKKYYFFALKSVTS